MRIQKIFNQGEVLNIEVYDQLQELDKTDPNFKGCNNEFLPNRDWWVILDNKSQIIAYCGSLYSQGVCIFVRAWVDKKYRGMGIQKRFITLRLREAKKQGCHVACTYTTRDNYSSVNNLMGKEFKYYNPEYAYGGKDMMYFRRELL